MNVLIADKLPDICIEILEKANIKTVNKPSISHEDLINEIGEYDGIVIRSGTKVSADVIEKGDKLKAVCRAGVGIDNVDVAAASKKGIVVMNAPEGNITATAEHSIAMLLALARNIGAANRSLRNGEWERKKYVGSQIAGKTLGVVGMGRVGRMVAKRGAAMDMKAIGFDPFITPEMASEFHTHLIKDLNDLFREADYISIHVPLNNDTKNLITKKEIDIMKDGVCIINCARGGIVSESDLYDAMVAGKVKGAAFDVFEEEPPKDNKLIQLDQMLATPHLAASTVEAQLAVAKEAAEQMADALTGKGFRNAMNIRPVDMEELEQLKPYLDLAEKMGSFLMQLTKGHVRTVNIVYNGEISNKNIKLLTDSFMVGLFRPSLEAGVNLVNIPHLTKDSGIAVNETVSNVAKDFTNLITASVTTKSSENSVSGTVFDKKETRIVDINGYEIESSMADHMLVMFCKDKPGIIGGIGTLLSKKNINIARMTFGRKDASGNAISVINTDVPITRETADEVNQLADIEAVHLINF